MKNPTDGIGISKSKVISYLLLTVVFVATSYLSLVFVFHSFSDQSSFLSLSFLNSQVLSQLTLLLVIYFLLDALRFMYVLKTIGVSVKLSYIIKLSFINMFVSSVTPLATGGGFAQIYFLSKKGVPVGKATAASSIRTLLPIMFFSIATPILFIFDPNLRSILGDQSHILIGGLIVVFGVLNYLGYKLIRNVNLIKGLVYRLTRKRSRKLTKRLLVEIDKFAQSFALFIHGSRKDIFLSILFTLLFLTALFTFPIILIHALGYSISTFSIMSLQVVITFITYFAITPGATGIAEGGFSLLFSKFIHDRDLVTLTFSWRFFSVYVGVFIGLVLFYMEVFKGFTMKRINKKRLN